MTAPSTDAAIGAGLRRLRLEAGLTLAQLAEAMGITYQQVAKYEHGHNRMSLSRLFDLAEAVGRPAAECLGTIEAAVTTAERKGAPAKPRHARTLRDLYTTIERLDDREQLRCLLGLARGMKAASTGARS